MALIPPPNAAGIQLPANPQDPPTGSDVMHAKEYVKRLSRSKNSQSSGVATDSEIRSAERYEHEVVLANSLAGVAAPAWLGPSFSQLLGRGSFDQLQGNFNQLQANQLQGNVNQLQGSSNQLQGSFNQLHVNSNQLEVPGTVNQLISSINEMKASLQRVESRQENVRIARLNYMELTRNTGATTYRAKQKDVAGDGTLLANVLLPPNITPLAALRAVPAIGAIIAPTINTYGLTHQAILQIIQFYNNQFEIQLGDAEPTRAQKIVNWLTMDI